MVTTRRMQGVSIDPERRIALLEAGVKWHRLLEAAAEFGLAGLCGSSSDVGGVGYTLGGGMGSLGRQYGFAADHVQAVEIVTAEGRLRRKLRSVAFLMALTGLVAVPALYVMGGF